MQSQGKRQAPIYGVIPEPRAGCFVFGDDTVRELE